MSTAASPPEGRPTSAISCCRWDEIATPRSQTEALKLRDHAADLLEVIERDASRWMSLLRCRACGKPWVEEAIDSGQMTAFFAYPIRDPDPAAWYAAARPIEFPVYDISGWGFGRPTF